MDLQSYIELKKKYSSMNNPQPVSEEVEVVEEEVLDEVLRGVDGKPLPISDKARNDAAYATKAAKFKRENPGVTDYTNYQRGGGDAASPINLRTSTSSQARRQRELIQKDGAASTAQSRAMQKDNRTTGVGPKPSKPDTRTPQQRTDSLIDTFSKANPNDKTVQALVKNRQNRSSSSSSSSPSSSSPSSSSSSSRSSSPSSSSSSSSSAPKPAAPKPAAPKPAAQTGNKTKDMQSWAKANPTLASKVKPGQSGYKAVSSMNKPTSTPKPTSASPKPSTPSPSTTKPAPTSSSSSSNSIKSSRLNKALSGVKKFGEEVEVDSFDIILEYLTDSGFPEQEALVIMAEMSEEKRAEILEGMKHREVDTGKVVDKAEVGKTYYPHGERKKSSVALRKEKEKKEMKEERSDTLKDRRMEFGGVDGNTDYSRPPKNDNSQWGKKKSDPDSMRKAMEMVRKNITDKYGKGAIMDTKKKKD